MFQSVGKRLFKHRPSKTFLPVPPEGELERLRRAFWGAQGELGDLRLRHQALEAQLARAEGRDPAQPMVPIIDAEPMSPLPTDPNDPRLEGWYHTIELAPGLVTRNAVYDHRATVDLVGLPPSLEGKSALDVGTADGFWAFEMERRGAAQVVAADITQMGESDVIPTKRGALPDWWATSGNYCAPRFATARVLRKSRVEYRHSSIYRVSPESIGTFDVVYCGALLVHLFNPLQALIRIRSVTREMAVIETVGFQSQEHETVEKAQPDAPYLWFGSLAAESDEPGKYCMYWRFTQKALCDMLIYAGFARAEPRGRFRTTGPGGGDLMVTSAVGYV